MMPPDLIQRWQPGGDIYAQVVAAYGVDAANACAAAATTGDRTQVTAALESIKYGQPLQDSTAALFLDQITSDPLAAPLASADGLIRKTLLAFAASPFVAIAAVAGIAAVVFIVRRK
jgi:hypothetical protein